MKNEFSAGGIIYTKQNGKLMWLICQHSQHKGWVFPKGIIGDTVKDEKSEDTAVREVEEETGAKAKIIRKLPIPATYWYVWQGEKRFKTVIYYVMEFIGGDINKHDHEMMDVKWVETEKVLDSLTYKSDKEAFREVQKLLKEKEVRP